MIKYLALTLLSLGALSIHAQNSILPANGELDVYFSGRIQNLATDSTLVPYTIGKKIKQKDAEQYKALLWEAYRSQVNRLAPLVTATKVPSEDIPTHSWSLIKEDPMPFYYILKGSHEAKQKILPLFLALHGSGPKDAEFAATLALCQSYKDSPSYYFIPQIPTKKRYRWWYKPEQYAWEKLFRSAFSSGSINPNKVYIMGISEGGYGSQRLGAFYADYLAGAGPMAGGEPLENAPVQNYSNTAFSLETGAEDNGFGRNTLTIRAKADFDSLEALYPGQYVHKIVLQEGKVHHIDYSVTTPWLKEFNRHPHPLEFNWIRFAMDGRYRSGFYNLALEKDLGTTENAGFDRTFFYVKFDKANNEIHIEAHLTNPELSAQKQITKGQLAIFLDTQYVDFNKRVTVFLNGKRVYRKKVNLDIQNMVESCALYGDPERIFPGKISISL